MLRDAVKFRADCRQPGTDPHGRRVAMSDNRGQTRFRKACPPGGPPHFCSFYSIRSPNGATPLVSTVFGNSPEPQIVNDPKSLYQSPSGARGPAFTQSCNRRRSWREIRRSSRAPTTSRRKTRLARPVRHPRPFLWVPTGVRAFPVAVLDPTVIFWVTEFGHLLVIQDFVYCWCG